MTRAPRSRSIRGSGAGAATSIVPGTMVAPQSSTRSFEAIACARIVRSGCSCFSKRAEASERSDSRREVCRMFGPFQFATSSRTLVVPSATSETWPPMIPAMPLGRSRSQTSTIVGVELPLDAVESRDLLPLAGGADDQLAAGHLVQVEGVQRLRGQQHHVVGDVDDVGDRPLPGGGEALPQPERRGTDLHVA